jgi:DNA-binding transcriptional ArsR family regulator
MAKATTALEEAIRDLQARVAELEHRDAATPGEPVGPARPSVGLIEALSELEEPKGEGVPAGAVTYAGVASVGDDSLAWQMTHRLGDLLALDDAVLARPLSALSSPVRLRILRELAAGPLQTHELQARLDEPSAGQLYHHLRELLATGLLRQPRRSMYELPDRAVVPLMALLACANDLSSGRQAEPEDAT